MRSWLWNYSYYRRIQHALRKTLVLIWGGLMSKLKFGDIVMIEDPTLNWSVEDNQLDAAGVLGVVTSIRNEKVRVKHTFWITNVTCIFCYHKKALRKLGDVR